MISKAKIKFIRSLEQKKYRRTERLFVAEGPKVVSDIMKVVTPVIVVATSDWINSHRDSLSDATELYEVDHDTLCKVSFLQHPQHVIAVFPQESLVPPQIMFDTTALSLALDGVQDPGNLGTIIRIADWFGIKNIYCSLDTADVWNPKVVQATMGSIARVAVRYQPLTELLDTLPPDFPVYGTMLDGDDISETKFNSCGIIVMGNEGNGISPDIAQRLNHRVLIPNFPKGEPTADSLNVAIATAITCFVARNAK